MTDKMTFSAGTDLPEIEDSIASGIAFLTRTKSPLLAALGFPGRIGRATNVRHEWLEEALNPNSGQINGALPNGNETTLVFDTPQAQRFRVGDILQAQGSRELISVTTVDSATNLTVVRAIRGTTGAAIADNAIIRRVNNPAVENETAPAANPVNRSRPANYTEIFRDQASVSRSAQKVKMLGGITNSLEHQVMLTKLDLVRNIAMSVVRGAKQTANPEGTASAARTMDGIIQFILNGDTPSIVEAGGVALTEDLLNEALEDAYSKGGAPTLIATHPKQKKALSKLLEGRVRYVEDSKTLGTVVTQFQSDFGTLQVIEPDIFVPEDVVLLLDPNRIQLMKLGDGGDPFEVSELNKVGLVDNREVVTELTLEMKNAGDGGHALIEGLSYA